MLFIFYIFFFILHLHHSLLSPLSSHSFSPHLLWTFSFHPSPIIFLVIIWQYYIKCSSHAHLPVFPCLPPSHMRPLPNNPHNKEVHFVLFICSCEHGQIPYGQPLKVEGVFLSLRPCQNPSALWLPEGSCHRLHPLVVWTARGRTNFPMRGGTSSPVPTDINLTLGGSPDLCHTYGL